VKGKEGIGGYENDSRVPEKGSSEWSLSDLAGEPSCAWFKGCSLPSSRETLFVITYVVNFWCL
jgi:hypothetical protein